MDKRLIVFFLISAGIMIGWNLLFGGAKPPVPTPPKPPEQAAPVGPGFWPALNDAAMALFRDSRPRAAAREDIVLASKHLRATFTNVGAGIRTLELIGFAGKDVPLLVTPAGAGPNFAMADVAGQSGLSSEPWEIVEQTPTVLAFEFVTRDGLKIRKRFALDPELHIINLELHLSNQSARVIAATIDWHVIRRLPNDGPYRADQYLLGLHADVRESITSIPFGQVKKGPVAWSEASRDWYGMRNRFFAVALLPRDSERLESGCRFQMIPGLETPEDPGMSLTLPVSVTVEKERTYRYAIYAGPLQEEALLETGGRKLVPLGQIGGGCFLFSWIVPSIAKLLLWVMAMMYKLVGNYGIAIILTTLVVRLCLFPLSRKSQISMAKYGEMQKALKPKMEAIQKKYADEPEKQRAAQMELFREHGMSLFPVAGCLPILLQLPVFIGMYSVFDQSLALRAQPFFGWIGDLSQSDHLFRISGPFNILWLIPFDGYFNLLPVLMTITWFLQSYFQPKSPDPQMAQQQKMMMWMPIFFGLMCYTLASGLSLYFFVNSLFGMAEQKLIKKLWLPPADAAAAGTAKA